MSKSYPNTLVATDIDGKPVRILAETELDGEGNPTGNHILATVDKAPWGWNEELEATEVNDVETQSAINNLAGAVIGKGNRVDYTAWPNELRENQTSNQMSENIRVPDGAKGVAITLLVEKASGVFGDNQGIRLRIGQRSFTPSTKNLYTFTTDFLGTTDNHNITLYPGVVMPENIEESKNCKAYSLVPFGEMFVSVQITGDFSDPNDTGFDFQIEMEWLF